MKEFLDLYNRLTEYLTDEECEDIACIVFVAIQRTVLPYDDLDDVSASLAFAKLSSDDCGSLAHIHPSPPSDIVPCDRARAHRS